jgi:hypothetical protein
MQRVVVIPYRRFWTTYGLILKGQGSKKKAPEDGPKKLSQNFGKELPLHAPQQHKRAQFSSKPVLFERCAAIH